MIKLDKSQYTKDEWRKLKEKLRQETSSPLTEVLDKTTIQEGKSHSFVLGNGTSRNFVDPAILKKFGPIYGCNALYRTFSPEYLIAVDAKMIVEINETGYQNKNQVWTNYNKAYAKMENFNYFQPSKGWSSGPTALWLASEHKHKRIYILGFDYKGTADNKVNNIYADSRNYKKSKEVATYYGNWLRQTTSTIREHPHTQYIRVIQADNFCPPELNNLSNYTTMSTKEFANIFGIS